MRGDARPSGSTRSRTQQLLWVLVLMLVGAFISVLLALGVSWATEGAITFWQVMIPGAVSAVVVPLWDMRARRKAAAR